MRTTLTRPRIALYATGSLGTGLLAAVPGVLLPYYMTSVLGIPVALAGLGVFLPKLWDMLIDPVVGVLSDRTRTRWGRRRPWLLVGAFIAPLFFALLFAGPAFSDSRVAFVYVVGIFLLSSTAYGAYGIPYVALPAEMSGDADERARIMAWRVAFVLGGLLIGSSLGPVLVSFFGGGRVGYRAMGLSLAALCCAAMLVVLISLHGLPLEERRSVPQERRRHAFANRPFAALTAVYVVQLIAMSTFSGALPYFAIHVLGSNEALVGTCMLVLLGVAIAMMPLWVHIARTRGRTRCLRDSVIIFAAAALALGLVEHPTHGFVLCMMALLGVGFSGQQVFPFAMLTDAIRFDTNTTGQARAATFSGLFIAAEKAGLAFGPLVCGATLALTGFGSGASPPDAQSLFGIRLALGTLPSALMLLSVVLLRFYKLADTTPPRISVAVSP